MLTPPMHQGLFAFLNAIRRYFTGTEKLININIIIIMKARYSFNIIVKFEIIEC